MKCQHIFHPQQNTLQMIDVFIIYCLLNYKNKTTRCMMDLELNHIDDKLKLKHWNKILAY